MDDEPLYKILSAALWRQARDTMPWAPVDLADGFVHLSARSQVRETARLHFAGQSDLVLLEIDAARLATGTLRWETSRGGALFPHVHGDVPRDAVVAVSPLREVDGAFAFPDEVA
jgi:uncharacterized protein (DUF952 family)